MTTSTRRSAASTSGPLAHAEPRLTALWATLTYALCTLMLAWPALGGGFLVSPPSDQYIGGWPVRDFAGQALKAGQGIPQWNPYLFGGLPYIAAMHGDIFYPTALLRLILPTDVGLTWGFILHVFLAGCFTYGFLRAWGLGFFPSLLAGVAYMMSGEVAALVSPGHDGKLFVSALMPLTLWLLVRGIRDGRLWAWGGIAIAVGLAVLSPHPQLLQYMLLTCGAFALYLALATGVDGSKLPRDVAVRRLAMAGAAVAIGFLIGAVQYLPVLEYVPWSPRAGGKGWEHAVSYSMPIEELLNVYLPQFSGILDNYWGRNIIHLHSEYLGAAALLLAGAAFGAEERKSFRRFWLVVLVISVLWALGGYTPFYHLVYAIVPGTKFFRAPSTMLMVVAFATSVLVGLGTERIMAGGTTRKYLIGWLIAGAVVALLATVGAFTSLAQAIAAGFPFDRSAVIDANRGAVALGGWRSLLFLGAAIALVWLSSGGRIDRRMLGWGLVAVVVLDLWSVGRLYWNFSPRASVIYASDPAVEYLRKADPGRVLVLQLAQDGIPNPRDPSYYGDALMVHRVRQLKGYHGNELGNYQRLASREAVGDYANLATPTFWRLSNARYLYTNALLQDTSLKFLLGPVKNSTGATVYLYRLPGDNPPAWLVPALVKAGDEATRGTILDPRFDPTRVAVIDSSSNVPSQTLTALPEPVSVTPKVTRYDAGHIALELSAPAPAGTALVVSENYFPGWTASVDGRPAATVRTDYTFIGVPLPAGARKIQLDYHDPAYARGKAITLVAVLLALAMTAGGALADRRRVV